MKNTNERIKKVLSGRPVIVTGAGGFVGSHLTEELLNYGAEVHVILRPVSSGTTSNLAHLRKKITIHKADLIDKESLRQCLMEIKKSSKQKPRPIIFHLAAQAHVGESWKRAFETFNSNYLGTHNLLQTIIDTKLNPYKISYAGSSEEYGNVDENLKDLYRFDDHGGLILDERSPLNPQSIYATSKLTGDFLFRNYHRAYNLPTVVARKFNNYGPRQNPRYITGTIITQALERNHISLGYLGAKRDFTFVKDGALGHIHVALFGKPGNVYCFGFGETISMKKWLKLILNIGKQLGYWQDKKVISNAGSWRGRLGKSEVEELRVDFSKLNRLTGWEPSYSWNEGISHTIKWYADNREAWIDRVDWK